MSFDSEFDFSNAIVSIDTLISEFTTNEIKTNKNLQCYGNVQSHYIDILRDTKNYLTSGLAYYNECTASLQNLKNQIQLVGNVSPLDKIAVHNFYTDYVSVPKNVWMSKMLYNIEDIIVQANKINIDGNITIEDKCFLANVLCEHYVSFDQLQLFVKLKCPQFYGIEYVTTCDKYNIFSNVIASML